MDNNVKILHLITEPTRFMLLQFLLEHNYCVKALAKKTAISEPAVSQHMRILKEYDIVKGVKIGYQTHYQVNEELICTVLKELTDLFSQNVQDAKPIPDENCSCEFISECIKRDSKVLKEQTNEK